MNAYTKHAEVRSQQRGIPALIIDLLLEFGTRAAAHDGSERIYFDKAGRRKLRAYAGPLARGLEQHLDCFAVVADGLVVTVGYRLERIKRDLH